MEQQAIKDGAILIGTYGTIQQTTILHFRCKCGTNHFKQVRACLKGFLCHFCTKKRAAIRSIQTKIEQNNRLLFLTPTEPAEDAVYQSVADSHTSVNGSRIVPNSWRHWNTAYRRCLRLVLRALPSPRLYGYAYSVSDNSPCLLPQNHSHQRDIRIWSQWTYLSPDDHSSRHLWSNALSTVASGGNSFCRSHRYWA